MMHNYYLWTQWQWDVLTKERCSPLMWTVADGQSVVGSGYWPHNIFDEKILLLLILVLKSKIDDLIVVTAPLVLIYEELYCFFVITVKINRWLLSIWITPISTSFLNTKLIYSPTMSFSHHICCCFVVCNHINYFIDQN